MHFYLVVYGTQSYEITTDYLAMWAEAPENSYVTGATGSLQRDKSSIITYMCEKKLYVMQKHELITERIC